LLELDFALLADFAQISEGKLTTVGGCFNFLKVSDLPSHFTFSVAGRVRTDADLDTYAMTVKILPPSGAEEVSVSSLFFTNGSRTYDGKMGHLFCLNCSIPILTRGIHEVQIYIESDLARTLKFEVE
jgi:hypothetical protein